MIGGEKKSFLDYFSGDSRGRSVLSGKSLPDRFSPLFAQLPGAELISARGGETVLFVIT